MLTGCTPAIEGFIGLERTGDSFRAVVSMCDGTHITKVELRDRSLVNSQSEYEVIEEWDLTGTDGGIFSAMIPDDSGLPDELGSGDFMLWGTVGGIIPSSVMGPVFTAKDLDVLGDGEILSIARPGLGNVIYSTPAELRAATKLYCED